MRLAATLLCSMCFVSTGRSAVPFAPADWASDNVATIIYDPAVGSLSVDNPAGDDAAADAFTTFELVSSEPFFTGPKPQRLFDGLFDVWSPFKAFRIEPRGFFDLHFPEGSVETGVINANEILTLGGSFLGGGPAQPVDFLPIPEPNGSALIVGFLVLAKCCRRRN